MSAWNRDDIIRMAREVGASTPRSIWPPTFQMSIDFSGAQLERFAALVAAHKTEVAIAEAYRCGHEAGVVEEREACARVCEARYMGDNNREDMEAKRCAEAIRNRSAASE